VSSAALDGQAASGCFNDHPISSITSAAVRGIVKKTHSRWDVRRTLGDPHALQTRPGWWPFHCGKRVQ